MPGCKNTLQLLSVVCGFAGHAGLWWALLIHGKPYLGNQSSILVDSTSSGFLARNSKGPCVRCENNCLERAQNSQLSPHSHFQPFFAQEQLSLSTAQPRKSFFGSTGCRHKRNPSPADWFRRCEAMSIQVTASLLSGASTTIRVEADWSVTFSRIRGVRLKGSTFRVG